MPDLGRFSADVEAVLQRGFQRGTKALLDRAVRRSSGPFSSAQLAAKDHPFATRHGSPRLDPSTINVQTGVFRSRWRSGALYFGPTEMRSTVLNDDPKADLLERGNARTFGRPIREALEAEGQTIIETAIERDLARTLSRRYS